VVGYENPAVPKGLVCFRWLMTSRELLEDPETKGLMEGAEGRCGFFIDRMAGKRLVWYPCRE